MAVSTERAGNSLIVKTEGRVDGSNARAFQSELEDVIADEQGSVILDLEDLTYISSAGLRVILLVAKSLREGGVEFGVCSLQEPIREVFQISGFDQIIPVHETQAVALGRLQS